MKRLGFTLVAVFGLTLAMGSSAFADAPKTFYLNSTDDSAPTGAVLVTVTWISMTEATVNFTGEIVGGVQYYVDPVFLNVNGAFSVGNVAPDGTSCTQCSGITGIMENAAKTGTVTGKYNAALTGSLDTFGEMSLDITPNPGITGVFDSTSLTVTLYATGGNTWAGSANVLIPTCPNTEATPSTGCGGQGVSGGDSVGYSHTTYAQGFDAAAGINTDATGVSYPTNDLVDAGFETTSSVPEPTSVILFGSVALLLGGALRRKLVRS